MTRLLIPTVQMLDNTPKKLYESYWKNSQFSHFFITSYRCWIGTGYCSSSGWIIIDLLYVGRPPKIMTSYWKNSNINWLFATKFRHSQFRYRYHLIQKTYESPRWPRIFSSTKPFVIQHFYNICIVIMYTSKLNKVNKKKKRNAAVLPFTNRYRYRTVYCKL